MLIENTLKINLAVGSQTEAHSIIQQKKKAYPERTQQEVGHEGVKMRFIQQKHSSSGTKSKKSSSFRVFTAGKVEKRNTNQVYPDQT